MPLTSQGSLFGLYDGQASGNTVNSAWSACNTSEPNINAQTADLFQVFTSSGLALLNVNAAGTVTVLPTSVTPGTLVARIQISQAAYNTLSTSPSAAQVMAAALPANYNGQQLDVFQVSSQIATPNVLGGGGVIFRFLYNGSTATS